MTVRSLHIPTYRVATSETSVQPIRRTVARLSGLLVLASTGLLSQVPASRAEPRPSALADTDALYARFRGNYGGRGRTILSVGRDDDGRTFVMDYARSVRSWVVAKGDTLRTATGTTFALREGGNVLALCEGGLHSCWSARRTDVRHEATAVTNGSTRLAGTLWTPSGAGPFPAVVLVQGAGEETRDAMRQYPYFFVAHGFAVVSYDKRGSGESTGDWHPWEAGIDALAGDALAFVTALRSRDDVAPKHVGLLGISNGAWVIGRAAARSSDVAFLIPISGGGIRIADQERYRMGRAAASAGLPKSDRAALDQFLGEVYSPHLLASDTSAAGRGLVARIRAARSTSWFALTPLTPFADAPPNVILDVGGRAWARELSYSADSDLARVRVPVLAIAGAADHDVPAERNLAGVRRGLARRGNSGVTTLLLPGASHALLLPPRQADEDLFAPSFFGTLGSWLDMYRARSID